MSPLTLLQFLFGGRRAIEQVANGRHSLWVGLLFVLSAALAREWDQADILTEGWHLLLPLVASLASASILYGLLYALAGPLRFGPIPGWPTFPAFLAAYWFTAPLAWLYAIPVERWCDELTAVQLNLLFLATVSVWRTLLIIRVIEVLKLAPLFAAIPLVLLFADTLALAAIWYSPRPIFELMGGIRHSRADDFFCLLRFLGRLITTNLWPIILLWCLSAAYYIRRPEELHSFDCRSAGRSIWAFACGLIVLGLCLLPFGQPQRRLQMQVEQELFAGRFSAAIALMAAHPQSDFPPYWSPPPRSQYGERSPDLLKIGDALSKSSAPDWVWRIYVNKLPHARLALEPRTEQDQEAYLTLLDVYLRESGQLWSQEDENYGFIALNRDHIYPLLDPSRQERLVAIWKAKDIDLLRLNRYYSSPDTAPQEPDAD